MPFSNLAGRVAELTKGVRVDLGDLLAQLWVSLNGSGNPERVSRALELRARQAAFLGFEAGALAQHSDFTPGALPDAYNPPNIAAALRQGALMASRATAVLVGHSQAYVAPYADLTTQILNTGAARQGTRAAGVYNGATRKQFVRLRQVQEPRSHSSLEGKTIPVDDLFDIGGYLVYGPGDDALPWSEKAFCGHILRYLK